MRRLARRARRDLAVRRGTIGLFYGLLPGLAAAALSATVALPVSALLIAACSAGAGLLAGVVSALACRTDRRQLLIRADQSLGSRELASTALELARGPEAGTFSEAVIQDAADLLCRYSPRKVLGRQHLPFLPFLPALAALIAAALLFPVDFRSLFPQRNSRSAELAILGEDLRAYGEKLQDAARADNLDRGLALSQELAQLGQDLADRKIGPDEALERMSDLETRIMEEYQLRLQEMLAQNGSGQAGSDARGNGAGSEAGGGEGTAGQGPPGMEAGASGQDQGLKDLGGALDKLRQARNRLSSPDGTNGSGQGSASTAQRPKGEQQGGSASAEPPSVSGSQALGSDTEPGQGDKSGQGSGQSGEDDTSAQPGTGPGSTPAQVKKGPPTAITEGSAGPSLRAQGTLGEGDLTRLLARALPEGTGSRLPDAIMVSQYARQAESALAGDEVPLALKEYVKGYFTVIGMSKAGAAQ
ncbi:MAG: hypothetical protein ABSF77_02365 [Spirochaetia bacterium]